MKLKIIVLCYNAHPWIERCLESIAAQTYTNYDVCIIDDASTQKECRKVIERYPQWKAIFNEERVRQLPNVIKGVEALDPDDDDVLMVIDGDDWLANPWVFEQLNEIYTKEDVWLTFGQYLYYKESKLGTSCWPKPKVMRKRSFRRKAWLYSQLRTYKAFLWKQIRDEDLRDASGNYYGAAWDLAVMFPMLEMAGKRIRHIEEVTYIYNDTNPLSDFRVHYDEQQANNRHIRKRRKYKRVEKPLIDQGTAACVASGAPVRRECEAHTKQSRAEHSSRTGAPEGMQE